MKVQNLIIDFLMSAHRFLKCRLFLFVAFLLAFPPYSYADPQYNAYYYPFPEPPKFTPEQIACTDKATSQSRTAFKAVRSNPDGDMYWATNEALNIAKKAANEGDLEAMLFFGDMRYERMYQEYADLYDSNHRRPIPYPDKTKKELVEAMTYSYIAAIPESPYQKDAAGFVRRQLERGGSGLTIPHVWIAEAKANAKDWKKYCHYN